jgi:hypothetical protein
LSEPPQLPVAQALCVPFHGCMVIVVQVDAPHFGLPKHGAASAQGFLPLLARLRRHACSTFWMARRATFALSGNRRMAVV